MKKFIVFITIVFCLLIKVEANNVEVKSEKMPIVPLYSITQLSKVFGDFIDAKVQQEIDALNYIGEEFVNNARDNGTYKDRTGNLRSSIGYVVLFDGRIIQQQLSGSKSEAKQSSGEFVSEIKYQYPKGLVLICFAGMQYAASVESKNYDVISNSAPTADLLKKAFNDIGIK